MNIKEAFDAIEYALMEQGYHVGKDFKLEYCKGSFKVFFCRKKLHRFFDINELYKYIGCCNIMEFKIQIHHDRQELILYITLNTEEECL